MRGSHPEYLLLVCLRDTQIGKNYYNSTILGSDACQFYDIPLVGIVDLILASGFSGCVRCHDGGVVAGAGGGRVRPSSRQLAVSVSGETRACRPERAATTVLRFQSAAADPTDVAIYSHQLPVRRLSASAAAAVCSPLTVFKTIGY